MLFKLCSYSTVYRQPSFGAVKATIKKRKIHLKKVGKG